MKLLKIHTLVQNIALLPLSTLSLSAASLSSTSVYFGEHIAYYLPKSHHEMPLRPLPCDLATLSLYQNGPKPA